MTPAAKARPPSIRGIAAGLFCADWLALGACAAHDCLIAYDMGSSCVRAGTDKAVATPGVDIDVLADVVADGRIDTTLADTIAALRELGEAAYAADPARCE